jgi:3-deoxy-D-manno-octulosonate 8-phosphate phosphatase (KDO 8-P phosphatase)
MPSQHLDREALRGVRFLMLDVDGVLTDGKVALLADGNEVKYFSIYDGLAIRLAIESGLKIGFLSGRDSPQVEARAGELGVRFVVQGCSDKLKEFQKIQLLLGLQPHQFAYMGDDLPDIALMRAVGFSAAPANAVPLVKECAHYITKARGGDGAVREVVELLLQASGKWPEVLGRFG